MSQELPWLFGPPGRWLSVPLREKREVLVVLLRCGMRHAAVTAALIHAMPLTDLLLRDRRMGTSYRETPSLVDLTAELLRFFLASASSRTKVASSYNLENRLRTKTI